MDKDFSEKKISKTEKQREKDTVFKSCRLFFLRFLFIYLWMLWFFIAVHGLSLVVVSRGYSSLWCLVFSLWWLVLLRGARALGSRAQ